MRTWRYKWYHQMTGLSDFLLDSTRTHEAETAKGQRVFSPHPDQRSHSLDKFYAIIVFHFLLDYFRDGHASCACFHATTPPSNDVAVVTKRIALRVHAWFFFTNSSGLLAAHSPSSRAPFAEPTVACRKLLPARSRFTCKESIIVDPRREGEVPSDTQTMAKCSSCLGTYVDRCSLNAPSDISWGSRATIVRILSG